MRIKNVLGYHGTSKLISTMALVLVASVGLVCLFNATSRADESEDEVKAADAGVADVTAVADATDAADDQAALPDETSVDGDDDYGVAVDVVSGDDDSGSKSKVRQMIEEFGQKDTTPMPEEGPAPDEVSKDADLASPEPEEADEPVKAVNGSIKTTKDNIFNKELPVFDGVAVDVTLNLPKGTKVEDNPDLDRFLAPDTPLESDVFSVYYKQGVDRDTFNKMVKTLTSKFGFTGIDSEYCEDAGVHTYNFIGSTKDGLNVTVEQFGNYLRISYYYVDSNGSNSFARLG